VATNLPSGAKARVIVRSRSELLRKFHFGTPQYYEEASISFPMRQIVKAVDHSDYVLTMGLTVEAKRRVRKSDWRPYGDGRWQFDLPFSPYSKLYWLPPAEGKRA
jgi:hypothetical protein